MKRTRVTAWRDGLLFFARMSKEQFCPPLVDWSADLPRGGEGLCGEARRSVALDLSAYRVCLAHARQYARQFCFTPGRQRMRRAEDASAALKHVLHDGLGFA